MSRWNKNILLKGFELKGSKHVSSYQGWNNIENDQRGNKNWFELAKLQFIEGLSYQRLHYVMCVGNPGEIDFGPSLGKVQLSPQGSPPLGKVQLSPQGSMIKTV